MHNGSPNRMGNDLCGIRLRPVKKKLDFVAWFDAVTRTRRNATESNGLDVVVWGRSLMLALWLGSSVR